MNAFLILAAAASLIAAAAHAFVGIAFVLRPLRKATLPRSVGVMLAFGWHIGSVSLLAMAAAFFYAGTAPEAGLLAALMTILAFTLAAASIGLIVARRLSPFVLPYWLLFGEIAMLGLIGILQGA